MSINYLVIPLVVSILCCSPIMIILLTIFDSLINNINLLLN